jgi:hypothetical protein
MKKIVLIFFALWLFGQQVKAQIIAENDTFTLFENEFFQDNVAQNDSFNQIEFFNIVIEPFLGVAILDSFNGNFSFDPFAGFGIDSFQYELCDLQQFCDSAWVFLVIETDSVWPGDANFDGIANNIDVLNIGLGFNTQGEPRATPQINWLPFATFTWPEIFDNGLSYKHADCNGDGIIDSLDVIAIDQNYNQTHTKSLKNDCDGEVPLFIVFDDVIYEPGDTVLGFIHLGTDDNPANDIYGLAFSLNYNNEFIVENSVQINFENSWIAPVNQSVNLTKDFWAFSNIDAAFSKTDQQNSTGNGPIASLIVIIDDNLAGKAFAEAEQIFEFSFSNIYAISNDESEIELCGETSSFLASQNINSIKTPSFSDQLKIYPNPTQNELNITLENDGITNIKLYDISGKIIYSYSSIFKEKVLLENLELNKGLYFIEVENSRQQKTIRKVIFE